MMYEVTEYQRNWHPPLIWELMHFSHEVGADGSTFPFIYYHRIMRATPRGWFIDDERFILDGNGKRYAYPTMELAYLGFIKRKERERKILLARLKSNAAGSRLTLEHFRKHQLEFEVEEEVNLYDLDVI